MLCHFHLTAMVAREVSAVIHLVCPARDGAISLKELCLYDFFTGFNYQVFKYGVS